jgi:hypothetical protein
MIDKKDIVLKNINSLKSDINHRFIKSKDFSFDRPSEKQIEQIFQDNLLASTKVKFEQKDIIPGEMYIRLQYMSADKGGVEEVNASELLTFVIKFGEDRHVREIKEVLNRVFEEKHSEFLKSFKSEINIPYEMVQNFLLKLEIAPSVVYRFDQRERVLYVISDRPYDIFKDIR